MDTSEIYIKMSDCPELQLKRKIKLGDYMALRGTGMTAVCVHRGLLCRFDGVNINDPQTEWIKLFHQDQIQEMMEFNDIPECIYEFHEEFIRHPYRYEFFGKAKHGIFPEEIFKSMEQLWLAFYIYRKHGKIWDGEKWAKK